MPELPGRRINHTGPGAMKRLSKCLFSKNHLNVLNVFPSASSHHAAKKLALVRQSDLGRLPPHDLPCNVFELLVEQCHGQNVSWSPGAIQRRNLESAPKILR